MTATRIENDKPADRARLQDRDGETSVKIRNMSLICSLLVVLIHTSFANEGSVASWIVEQFVCRGIATIAVPFFFVVSGYFLARHINDQGWYYAETKKRVKSLLLPFVLWTGIAFCLVSPLSIVADMLAHRPFGTSLHVLDGQWITAIGLDPRRGPYCLGALWYIRCLFIFVLVSPLFKFLILRFGLGWLIASFAISLAHSSSLIADPSYESSVFLFGFSLSGMFYF